MQQNVHDDKNSLEYKPKGKYVSYGYFDCNDNGKDIGLHLSNIAIQMFSITWGLFVRNIVQTLARSMQWFFTNIDFATALYEVVLSDYVFKYIDWLTRLRGILAKNHRPYFPHQLYTYMFIITWHRYRLCMHMLLLDAALIIIFRFKMQDTLTSPAKICVCLFVELLYSNVQ